MEDLAGEMECIEHSRPGETFGTCHILGQVEVMAPFTRMAISRCTVMHISKKSLEVFPWFNAMQLPNLVKT